MPTGLRAAEFVEGAIPAKGRDVSGNTPGLHSSSALGIIRCILAYEDRIPEYSLSVTAN